MYYLGLDIGTTSVCAIVLDGNGNTLYTTTRPNAYHGKNVNGERTQAPSLRASILGLSEKNFNAQALTLATLRGISRELKDFYTALQPITGKRKHLIGSGNALRMNPVLRHIVEEDFGAALHIPVHKEEAAFGAALLAAETLENTDLKGNIRYEN